MDQTVVVTGQAVVAVICWLIVAAGATLAVFSPQINDTILERVGLSAVAITSVGTACRIVRAGWISDGSALLAVALAGYVVVVVAKHARRRNDA